MKRRTYSAESFFMTGRVGTMAYMAHEVALCKPYNEKVDIYGFGMILWQLATGGIHTYIHTYIAYHIYLQNMYQTKVKCPFMA